MCDMYLRYKSVKYFVNIPASEYKGNPVPILLNKLTGSFIKITSWLGTRPQKVEVEDDPDPKQGLHNAVPCLHQMPGTEITPPIPWAELALKLHKEKTAKFTVYTSFSKDLLAHTEGGFKQELIGKILLDERHEGKIEVVKFKVVGVEVPDQLIIHFSVQLRSRF